MRALIAVDFDHTLDVEGGHYPVGPVPLGSLRVLRGYGHIVGICGNWPAFLQLVPGWETYASFLGPMQGEKSTFLKQLKAFAAADRYVMVGNNPYNRKWKEGVSNDSNAAYLAGYEFVEEDNFDDFFQGLCGS